MRGGDVAQSGVKRDRWLNGAVYACRADCTVLVEYGDLAYRVICLRRQQFRSDTRGVGRVCGSGVMVVIIDNTISEYFLRPNNIAIIEID